MNHPLLTALLWFGAIGCGLMAGVYFAFSAFIMAAFDRVGPAHAIAAMNAINTVILRSQFMPLFYGTTLASLILAAIGLTHPSTSGSTPMAAGGLIYFAGMFLCTVVRNVPLNNALAATDPATPSAEVTWTLHRQAWTRWNHLRTISAGVAAVLFTAAIVASGT